MECDRDIRELYKVIYNITGKYSIKPLSDSDSDKELTDKLVYFFINKIRVIRDQLNKYPKYNLGVNAKAISMTLSSIQCQSSVQFQLRTSCQ